MNPKQVMRRYVKEFLIAMSAYVTILILSISILNRVELPKLWQVVISLAPALPVAFVIFSIMRLLIDSDELQQRVQLLATSFAAALTGLITFSYGFLENVGFPKFPTFFIFPLIIFLWGIGLAYFSKRYR
jgi:hypothetical protein